MIAVFFAIISGISMSVQGVFDTRLSEKIGLWETTVLVQGSAFIITLIITFFFGKGGFSNLKEVNKLYLLGGVLGIIITFTVMKSIGSLGATYAIGIILLAQIVAAALIDAFGLFGSDRLGFHLKDILGVIIMLIGIIIFKWNR